MLRLRLSSCCLELNIGRRDSSIEVDHCMLALFLLRPCRPGRAGSGVEIIDPLCFLTGCRKRRLSQAPTVLSLLASFLPARRRPQGLVVIGVCLSVCLSVCVSVCVCALFLSARYLKNGSWITTKFGGWEQGVNL